jgi:DUF438 domain-containing protein
MSTNNIPGLKEKAENVKKILKELHQGRNIEELKSKYGDVLSSISPFEISLIEQKLVEDGVKIEEILKLCDLHVELFREYIGSREIKDVPKGHPLDLLIRENDWILKEAEALTLYASALLKAQEEDQIRNILAGFKETILKLTKIRLHYRKLQMLIFPYLERRGIIAPTRVLWGREDQARLKLRQLMELLQRVEDKFDPKLVFDTANRAIETARDISELVFRENKILYPTVQTLLTEGEWAAVSNIAESLGYIIDTGDERWRVDTKPILPYEEETIVTREQAERLPLEFRAVIASQLVEPDTYRVKKDGDMDLETGFLSPEEAKAVFKSLPIEITFANEDGRVKFFTESMLSKGFVRIKTIIGRRFEYCHPPRLEDTVRKTVDEVKFGEAGYREFWTRNADRIIRVLIVPVKNGDGDYLGTVEIVEDLSEIVNKPEEVKKRIMVI